MRRHRQNPAKDARNGVWTGELRKRIRRPWHVHSVMNKITGGLLFVLPLTVRVIDLRYSAAIVCAVATFAAMQEGHLIRTRPVEEKTDFCIDIGGTERIKKKIRRIKLYGSKERFKR